MRHHALRTLALGVSLALVGLPGVRADAGPVPLERSALGELGGWITLAAVVDGHAGRWLLDTGASRNLVSPAFASRLGLRPAGRVSADTPFGQIQGDETDLPPLRVGGLERSGQRALVVELSKLLGAAAEGVDGVLGVPWFDGVQAELDLRRWTASFRTDGAADCPAGLAAVALTRHRTLPVISLAAGPATERYVLDTGNPAGLIRVEADAPGPATPGLVVPGDLRLTVLHEARLGPQQRFDVPVMRLASAALRRALGDAARGLAGTAFIDGARWQLDLARDRLCVEPGRFVTPGGFGLVPERQSDALTVQLVLPGSPAQRAGLRAGDRITEWAGLPASQPLPVLWRAVQGQPSITLTVGEPARQVTLDRAIFAPAAP